MLNHHPPADRLAAIRARIEALEEEEAKLRIAFLENGDYGLFPGHDCNVVVEREEAREFDPSRLPVEIRLDPQYWTTRFRTHVTVQEKSPMGEWEDDDVIELVDRGQGTYG